MNTNKLQWISAAENCLIWNDDFQLDHTFPRYRGNIIDAAWSHSNRNIAYIERDRSEITVATIAGKVYHDTTLISEGEPTALGFSNESLIVGTTLGNVLLWDHSKHKLIRKYAGNDKSSISRVQSNNSIIAAGHGAGNIFIYGTKTSQTIAHYFIPNSMGLRDLKISTVKPSLLAAAYNSGTVAAWNTVSKTNNSPLVEFSNVHQSPATCIALSPVTDILMVSGGLDKNIVLYDFLKKKVVKKIEAEAPITAIDFFPDGTCLIVGTNKGKVLVYDLRSNKNPVQSVAAHSSAINKLICRWRSADQFKIGSDKDLILASEPVVISTTPRKIEETHVERESSFCTETVFSQHNEFASLNSANVTKEIEYKNSSLFSPLKGEFSDTMFSSLSLATSPVLNYKVPQNQIEQPQQQQPQQPQQPPEQLKDSEVDRIDMPKLSCTNSEQMQEKENMTKVGEDKVAANCSTDFQVEFIRRIVHDVEDNLREVLRCRFGDLIIQSAQQFLTLQNEMEQLKQQVQDKAYLEEEVRRLRCEVNQLRNLY